MKIVTIHLGAKVKRRQHHRSFLAMPMAYLWNMRDPRLTIWYDGGCLLCRMEIAFFQRLDAKKGRLHFVDLEGDGTCPLDRADMLARFHAQEVGQPVVSGAAAFAAMWRQVTPFQPLGWLAKIPPVLWLLERLYRLFLRVRPSLQSWARAQ
jgi:predicted DCC family thiol-disulfide oxidoreductase YuxK